METSVPVEPDRTTLTKLYSEGILGNECRYAVVRQGREVRALFLADDLVPHSAVRFSTSTRIRGKWATSALQMGDWGGGRVFIGPSVFFRQVDLKPREAWLAPVLMGFPCTQEVRQIAFGPDTVYELNLNGSRYYYLMKGGAWKLYGAGNTPQAVIDRIIHKRKPPTAIAFLWVVGAVELGSD